MSRSKVSLGLLLALSLLSNCGLLSRQASAEHPNILLICVDDLRPELNCYGVDYIESPNIDQLAKFGRQFNRHYVQAPTCGASRYTLLTGLYGSYGNDALFKRARQLQNSSSSVPPSMPAWFRQHGYQTVSVGKVSHHPGGLGGPDWDDPTQPEMPLSWDRNLMPSGNWKHPRGVMHGLANGEIRQQAGDMDIFQSFAGEDSSYPDGLTLAESMKQLEQLTADEAPFFLAVGLIRPHLPFGAPARYFTPYENATLPEVPYSDKPDWKSTWHGSGEFMKYNRWGRNPNQDAEFATDIRKHYAACVTYADRLIGRLLEKLDETGEREKTIIVIWGDHGWHLGERAVWGKHTLFEESLRSPLIICVPGMQKPGVATNAIAETIDIFPTLCQLAELPMPDFSDGRSLADQIRDPDTPGRPAISYTNQARSIRTDRYRLIEHKDGSTELYELPSPRESSDNVANSHPEMVETMKRILDDRLPSEVSK